MRVALATCFSMLLGIGTPDARAQGLDGHGPILPADSGDPARPLRVLAPERQSGAVSVGLVGEYADELVVTAEEAKVDEAVVRLGPGVISNFVVAWGPVDRVGFRGTLPLWLYLENVGTPTSFVPGDGQLSVPVGLVLPAEDGTGWALSVEPWLRIPTGRPDLFTGDETPQGGIVPGEGVALAGGYFGPRGTATAYFGAEHRWLAPVFADGGLFSGGPSLKAGASGGLRLGSSLGAHLEVLYARGLEPQTPEEQQGHFANFSEVGASLRGRHGPVWWVTSVSTGGPQANLGQARLRVFAGAGAALERRRTVEIAEEEEREPEPDPRPVLEVADTHGVPVAGAMVSRGDVLGQTDISGHFTMPNPRFGAAVTVTAPGYLPEVVNGAGKVVMAWQPIPLRVSVGNPRGERLSADVTLTGPVASPQFQVGSDGTWNTRVSEGVWTVTASAAGYGSQTREIVVPFKATAPADVEFVLVEEQGAADLALQFLDTEGIPVEGTRILLDGIPIGSSTTGGTLDLSGLATGVHRLEISAHGYRPVEQEVDVSAEGAHVDVRMTAADGVLKLKVLGPDGPVGDAQVVFTKGNDQHPVQSMGPTGERRFQLTPGTWKVLVMSEAYGMQERDIALEENAREAAEVVVSMAPAEHGTAQLDVYVVDASGQEVEDVEVFLDGRSLGKTTNEGALRLKELSAGPRVLTMTHPRMLSIEPRELFLAEGVNFQRLRMDWVPGTVRVVARAGDLPAADVVLRVSGSTTVAPVDLGSTGAAWLQLAPGSWDLLFESPTFGLLPYSLTIPEEQATRVDVEVNLALEETGDLATLRLRVVDPRGRPVPAAEVLLDGTSQGTTSGDGSLDLRSLPPGTSRLEVHAAEFASAIDRVQLVSGAQERVVELGWGTGAVEVKVTAQGGPVSDGFVRFVGLESRPVLPLLRDGTRHAKLTPGPWTLLVTSETWGIASVDIVLPQEPGLTEIPIDMAGTTVGTADLLVRVVDAREKPVENAKVRVDGIEALEASVLGARHLVGLRPGKVLLQVEAPEYRATELEISVKEGWQERLVILESVARMVRFAVTDRDGRPVPAVLRFEGPEHMAVVNVGDTGEVEVPMKAGSWEVFVRSPKLAAESRRFAVSPNAEAQQVRLALSEAQVDVTQEEVVIRGEIFFDTDRADIRSASDGLLDEVAKTLLANREIIRVEVQGHTDSVGDVAYNQALSDRRARAVRDALVARGVGPERLVARGYGPTRPILTNESEEGRAKNRRVQFDILEVSTGFQAEGEEGSQ